MALSILGMFLGLLLEVSTEGPTGIPRTSWKHHDVSLIEFTDPGIFNYSTLLLSEDKQALYVGAREAIFELNMGNISIKHNQVIWKVPESDMEKCILKGKSKETDCLNYIRVLQVVSDDSLYVCGTHAFQPSCDYLSLHDFQLEKKFEDGRGKCSFDPAQSFTTVMVDGELYSGTAYNFLGSEPIIYRYSQMQSLLRTEYSTSWLNEPSFVFADVIRESKNSPDGDDDKIYFFFTEVSVEYEFFGKLLIPRIARVCKGDLGGQRTLQKKWTSFLKAKLVCSMSELNFVFNVVHDVFILKTPDSKEPIIYGVFTSQWGNVGLSAVCAYNMSSVGEVFSKGKYMQKATVEQSHTKWVRFNGVPPSPRPGACINNNDRLQNINSSLHLPDKTLQFVRDHPLLEDPVLPIGNGPKLVAKDVNYTQIVVDRVQALDNNVYDVIFTGTDPDLGIVFSLTLNSADCVHDTFNTNAKFTISHNKKDKGILHKSIIYDGEVHIVEELRLLPNSEPIKTLLLSSQGTRFLYAGSDSGVVQSPIAFCEKYSSCEDCILARDPYCAWDSDAKICVNILLPNANSERNLIQNLNGDAHKCPSVKSLSPEDYQMITVKPGSSAELPCRLNSNLAHAVWKLNGAVLSAESSKFHLIAEAGMLIYSVSQEDLGHYECWSEEQANGKNFTQPLTGYILSFDIGKQYVTSDPFMSTTASAVKPAPSTEGNINTAGSPLTSTLQSSATPTSPPQPETTLTPWFSTTVNPLQKLLFPSPGTPSIETRDPSTEYLKTDNSNALLFLFLLFFILFLALIAYNCYMQYLPPPCLKVRAALLGKKKKPQPEYMSCEPGLMEPIVEKVEQTGVHNQNGGQQKGLRDTGYETEPEYANGKISNPNHTDKVAETQDKPFDVICESQPIEFADADAPC